MSLRRQLLSAVALGCLAGPADAADRLHEPRVTTDFGVERAYTSNALDRPEQLPDWLNTLRGAVSVRMPHEGGALALGLRAEQSAHDTYAIEDDSSVHLSGGIEHAATDRLTLGAEVGLGHASEGDDLGVGKLVLGIRTRTITASGTVKGAYRISDALALSGEFSASRAEPGKAVFEAGLIAPQQLSPRRDAIGGGLRVARASGRTVYAAAAGAELRQVGVAGRPPYDFTLDREFVRLEAQGRAGNFDLSASAGAERLAGVRGAIDVVRPSLAASALYAFSRGATLRGSLSAGLDLSGRDDPAAAWVRELALEAALPLGSRLLLTAGVSASRSEYLLLGYEEDAAGAFLAAKIALGHGLSLGIDAGASARRPLAKLAPVETFGAGVTLSYALPVADAQTAAK